MKLFSLSTRQEIPVTLETAWDFFSSPANLQKITPESMNFEITSHFAAGQKMYPGMIISYRVSPLFGIRMGWVTEITQCRENEYFIDEQRFGPFAFWHHEHHFQSTAGGVLMTDSLTYGLPFGALGRFAHWLSVEKRVREIFLFREKRVTELFG